MKRENFGGGRDGPDSEKWTKWRAVCTAAARLGEHKSARGVPAARHTLRMNRKLIIRQAAVIAAMAANAALSEVAAGVPGGGYADVVSAVRAGSVATLFLAAFLLAVALFCGRPAMITELPPFTMQSIWAHVYGLGLIVFVTVYCMLGVSSCCTAMYMFALAGVSVDDIFVRHWETIAKRTAVFLCTVSCAMAVAFAAVGSPDMQPYFNAVDAGNWFAVACGAVLPLTSPFIYTVVRGPRNYTPGMVVEFIYFATPFAVILSLVVLCTLSVLPPSPAPPPPQELEPLFVSQAEANWSHSHSANRSMESNVVERILLVTSADVAMPLLPLTMFPVLYLTVKSVFLHTTVDLLTAAAFVAAFKRLCHNQNGADDFGAGSLIFAAGAFAWRLYAISLCDSEDEAARESYLGAGARDEEQEKLAAPAADDDEKGDKGFDVEEV